VRETPPSSDTRLSAQLLLKNTSLNLVGQITPIFVALVSIPVLIQKLGAERFGVLMLAWMCLGYFSLFDFGLSRALTKGVAERLGTAREHEVTGLFWTTVFTTLILAVLGSMVVIFASRWLATSVLQIPAGLEEETRLSLLVIGASLPFVITSTSFRGMLEATQNFTAINVVQIPMGIVFYLVPLVITKFTLSLPIIIFLLVLCRIVGWGFLFHFCLKSLPGGRSVKLVPSLMPHLFKFGGWITLTNILSPIISYGDRFLVGVLVSISAVTYYSTPYEIVNKMWIFPGAVMGVLFPAIASYLANHPKKAADTYFGAIKFLFGVLAPLTLTIVLFAYEGLFYWAGPELAVNSALIMQILGIAIFINCFAVAPHALLEALGYPMVPAISHLIQLPIYFAALYIFLPKYGLLAAALIWVLRNLLDTSALFLFANRYSKYVASVSWKRAIWVGCTFVGLLVLFIVTHPSFELRLTIFCAFVLVFPPWLWFRLFTVEDRRRLLRLLLERRVIQNDEQGNQGSLKREKIGIGLAAYKPDITFFRKQLLSIKTQTYKNWVCVISFDSDFDLSSEEFGEFCDDPRFVWIRNKGPIGVNSNFNNAVSKLLTLDVDVIAFADQDDVWYENKLERLIEELRKCRPKSLVHSNMHLFYEDKDLNSPEVLEKGWEFETRVTEGYTAFHFLFRNTVTGASALFDVELAKIGTPIPASGLHHDQWFAILASIHGEVRPVYECLYAYRQHENNTIGAHRFNGIFYKPASLSWKRGFQNAAIGYREMQKLYSDLKKRGLGARETVLFRTVFTRPLLAGPILILMALLAFFDDPPLARAFLARGLGAGISVLRIS